MSRPSLLERLLGRRRVRALRHRVGWLAIGTGVGLLRPRLSRAALAARVGVGVLAGVGAGYALGALDVVVR